MPKHGPDLLRAFRLGFRIRSHWPRNSKGRIRRLAGGLLRPSRLLDWLTPIDLVRYREFAFVFRAVAHHAPGPRRILDIGSPKLLPLTLARHMPEARVWCADILDAEVREVRDALPMLDRTGVAAIRADARTLPVASASVDLLTSVSVLEHIPPERGGEIPAMHEIRRVLAPGGIACITVPFAPRFFAEYREGAVYERSGERGERLFFQRFHDASTLEEDLIVPSGLSVVERGFIEERFFFRSHARRLALYVNASLAQRRLFGLFYPLLAGVFLSSPRTLAACRKPYIACLVLRKN